MVTHNMTMFAAKNMKPPAMFSAASIVSLFQTMQMMFDVHWMSV